MPGESDETDFAGLFRCDRGFQGSAFAKDAVRVVESQDLMKLQEVNMIGLEAPEGIVQLIGGIILFRPSILVIKNTFFRYPP